MFWNFLICLDLQFISFYSLFFFWISWKKWQIFFDQKKTITFFSILFTKNSHSKIKIHINHLYIWKFLILGCVFKPYIYTKHKSFSYLNICCLFSSFWFFHLYISWFLNRNFCFLLIIKSWCFNFFFVCLFVCIISIYRLRCDIHSRSLYHFFIHFLFYNDDDDVFTMFGG